MPKVVAHGRELIAGFRVAAGRMRVPQPVRRGEPQLLRRPGNGQVKLFRRVPRRSAGIPPTHAQPGCRPCPRAAYAVSASPQLDATITRVNLLAVKAEFLKSDLSLGLAAIRAGAQLPRRRPVDRRQLHESGLPRRQCPHQGDRRARVRRDPRPAERAGAHAAADGAVGRHVPPARDRGPDGQVWRRSVRFCHAAGGAPSCAGASNAASLSWPSFASIMFQVNELYGWNSGSRLWTWPSAKK